MSHDHVRVAVAGARTPGVEYVPARKCGSEEWELIRSPLYATQLAAGDVIRVLCSEVGTFEIVRRGGNVSVQFYLAENEADDEKVTEIIAQDLDLSLNSLGGHLDGKTAGLIVFTIPVKAGFSAIEQVMEDAVRRHPGSQWQYCNVFDLETGNPLGWWED